MIRTSELIATGVRKSAEELYCIRAGEMLTKRLDGWHTEDIAALYKVSTRMVNLIIGEIPVEAKAMFARKRNRMGPRWIESIVLGEREAPPSVFDARELKSHHFSPAARGMIREMARRLDGGEPIGQVALSFGTTPSTIRRAVWEQKTRSRH